MRVERNCRVTFRFTTAILRFRSVAFRICLTDFVPSSEARRDSSNVLPRVPISFRLKATIIVAYHSSGLRKETNFVGFRRHVHMRPLNNYQEATVVGRITQRSRHIKLFYNCPITRLPRGILLFFTTIMFGRLLPRVPIADVWCFRPFCGILKKWEIFRRIKSSYGRLTGRTGVIFYR